MYEFKLSVTTFHDEQNHRTTNQFLILHKFIQSDSFRISLECCYWGHLHTKIDICRIDEECGELFWNRNFRLVEYKYKVHVPHKYYGSKSS